MENGGGEVERLSTVSKEPSSSWSSPVLETEPHK